MKIVINNCYGGFGFSKKAEKYLADHGVSEDEQYKMCYHEDGRDDPRLVELVETMILTNKIPNYEYSKLIVVEIPEESTDWVIDEYDGWETLIYVLNGKIKYAGQ